MSPIPPSYSSFGDTRHRQALTSDEITSSQHGGPWAVVVDALATGEKVS